QALSALLSLAGSGLGLCGVGFFLLEEVAPELVLPWRIPGGSLSVAMDGLSALFLVPVFLVTSLGSVYGLEYWRQSERTESGQKLRLFLVLLPRGTRLALVSP